MSGTPASYGGRRSPTSDDEAQAARLDDLLYMAEQGYGYVDVDDLLDRMRSPRFGTIFLRCFTSTMSLVLLAFLFVERYKYHDPGLQDPIMAILVFLSLCGIAWGFLITSD